MSQTYLALRTQVLPPADSHPKRVRLGFMELPVPTPAANEVFVRMVAAPVNPSDLRGGIRYADPTQAIPGMDDKSNPFLDLPLPSEVSDKTEVDANGESRPWGNEGVGVVEATGAGAEHLLGKTVTLLGGTMAAASLKNMQEVIELPLPDGIATKEAASTWVNPMTVLGMVEKMKREGHSAIVHTAAASQLGQMLIRVCLADGIPLVNIVRRQEQAEFLKGIGAKHVVVSTLPSFKQDLIGALAETGATIAFDALGGGSTVGTLLECMVAASGANSLKQIYNYGRLDKSPLQMNLDLATGGLYKWCVAGYMLPDFIAEVGFVWVVSARERVIKELRTTFATSYEKEISLRDLLSPQVWAACVAHGTNKKVLVML